MILSGSVRTRKMYTVCACLLVTVPKTQPTKVELVSAMGILANVVMLASFEACQEATNLSVTHSDG